MPSLLSRTWLWPAIALLAGALLFGGLFRVIVALAPLLAAAAILAILVWTFIGTRGQANAGGGAAAVSPVGAGRSQLGRKIDPQAFAEALRAGPPIGMPSWLARHVAVTLRAFLVKGQPPRPWSLMLATDEGWCLDEFVRRFCQGLSLAPERRPVTLECTAIVEFAREPLAKAITESGMPILIINATERLRRHARADAVTSPLEVILQGRDPLLKDIIILIVEKARPAAVHQQSDLAGQLREQAAALAAVSLIPVAEVDIACVLASTQAQDDRLTILWEDFCRYAAAEYAVTIANATTLEASPDDTMWDFLGSALAEWDQHGMPEAQKFVRLSSEPALARARVAGVHSARAVWEPASEQVILKTS